MLIGQWTIIVTEGTDLHSPVLCGLCKLQAKEKQTKCRCLGSEEAADGVAEFARTPRVI